MKTINMNESDRPIKEKKEYERVEIELIDFTGEDSIFECYGSEYY